MSVFISGQISEVKRQNIKSALLELNSNVHYSDKDNEKNVLRVVSDKEIDLPNKILVATVSASSIKAFVEKKLNPFNLKKTDRIKNLHLYGKTVSFTGITLPLLSDLSRLVLKMGGKISTPGSRIDYKIINPSSAFSNGAKCIKYQWLQVLIQSAHFVDPSDYLYSESSSPNSQLSSRSQGIIPLSHCSSRLQLVESQSLEEGIQLSQMFKSFSQKSVIRSQDSFTKPIISKPPTPQISEEIEESECLEEDDGEFEFQEPEPEVNKIDVFAQTKLMIQRHRIENMPVNRPQTKPISYESVIQFTQQNVDETSEEDSVGYLCVPEDQQQTYTFSQDPLMKMLQ